LNLRFRSCRKAAEDDVTDTDTLGPGDLETDRIPVRNLRGDDLDAVVRIDRQWMKRTRDAYYETKIAEATEPGPLKTSLVAELDDHVVGFVIARVYYGEFGRSEPVAVIDSIAVDEAYTRKKVAAALMRQLLMNLRALNVEHVESLVDWDRLSLIQFLARQGFQPSPRLCLRLEL
jgi:predicted N-acetyltransferase YhbS